MLSGHVLRRSRSCTRRLEYPTLSKRAFHGPMMASLAKPGFQLILGPGTICCQIQDGFFLMLPAALYHFRRRQSICRGPKLCGFTNLPTPDRLSLLTSSVTSMLDSAIVLALSVTSSRQARGAMTNARRGGLVLARICAYPLAKGAMLPSLPRIGTLHQP